ncbi:EamA domain-containing protein [[Candida] zeylanoides]
MTLRAKVSEYISIAFTSRDLTTRQKWILGLINLSSVVVFWVLSSFLVNDLFETNIYRKPFFITYINTGSFAFYLLPYLYSEGLSVGDFVRCIVADYHHHRESQRRKGGSYISLHQTAPSDPSLSPTGASSCYGSADDLSALEQQRPPMVQVQQGAHLNRAHLENSNGAAHTTSAANRETQTLDIPLYETIMLSLQFSVLWFSANLVTNASLSYTSVASQTILSSSSSFFTLIIGYVSSVEHINTNKVIGLVLSFVGVVIVTKIDSNDPPPGASSPLWILWGNLLALSGALFYGVYTILLKLKVMIKNSRKERVLNTHLFFAFVGIFSLVTLWPVLIVLHFTGHEKFALPSTSYATSLLLTNTLITFVSDLCWCKAVLLTSPLTVTVGLSMTIPLAMIGDWFIKGFSVNLLYLLGASIVTVGFLIINKDEEEDFVQGD